jgi:hypothetical protein
MNPEEAVNFMDKGGFELEDKLKEAVLIALTAKFGYSVSLSHKEWDDAKIEMLNDVYANKVCFFGDVTSDYFINIMVDVLFVIKRISAA